MGPKWEDTEEVSTSSAVPTWDDTEEIKDYSDIEVSQPEAFGVGAIQGSTLGTAPIASGVGGFLSNAVEQIGDTLGLTTDSQLEAQGFSFPDKKTGLEGLMSEYYDSRERMKGLQDASAEQHPWTTIAGNVVGAIPTTIASGGSTGALSKILPQADKFTKATKLGTKMLAGAREGAKAGALTGFGSGDAKLAEGEFYDTFRDTADSAVGGAVMGGIVPGVVGLAKGVGSLVTDLPISKQIATAFKGGKDGIKLNEEAAGEAVKTYSEDLLTAIRSQFGKAGLTKANAMDYADEIGVRVNAGEAFQDVMDDMIQRGASSADDQVEKLKLLKTFNELRNGPANKLADKLDTARAKQIQKMEAKGLSLLDEQPVKGNVQDYVPDSEANKALNLSKQTFQQLGEDGAEDKLVTKLVQQAGDELPIDINRYDLESLSLRDLEDVLGEINRHTGDLTGPAKTNTEKTARRLAGELRALSEEAIDGMGQGSSGNQALHKTFSALGRAGIDDNVLTGSQVRKDAMVDKLRNTVTASNPINRERMFQYLDEADPTSFKGFKENADFLGDFSDLAKQVKPLNSTNITGVLGSARNVGLSVANKAGSMAGGLNKLVDMPVEKLGKIAQRFGMSSNKAAQQYVGPLQKAAQASERQRSAILYGLYQQPAFRDMYQSLGEELNDIAMPEQENNN